MLLMDTETRWEMDSRRKIRQTADNYQNYDQIEPWSESFNSSKLPDIFIKRKIANHESMHTSKKGSQNWRKCQSDCRNGQKKQKLAKVQLKIQEEKRNNKIDIPKIERIDSFCRAEKLKFNRYDSEKFKLKTIKNIGLMDCLNSVRTGGQKSERRTKNKNRANFKKFKQNKFILHASVNAQVPVKIQQRLKIERKIFEIISKDRK